MEQTDLFSHLLDSRHADSTLPAAELDSRLVEQVEKRVLEKLPALIRQTMAEVIAQGDAVAKAAAQKETCQNAPKEQPTAAAQSAPKLGEQPAVGSNTSAHLVIATDGACSGNPGPGGWAWVNQTTGDENSGGAYHTTNNEMELTAVLEALSSLPPCREVTMRCDSQYVLNVLTKWRFNWEKNGWKTGANKPVANRELIEKISLLLKNFPAKINWTWVPGHKGDAGNERADNLAVAQIENYR